ncbi:MAG: 1-acyl-sn-glycerol-3-phosphate acyltransferase [Acholeplasmatales bacterium]|nr:MAG: 1-acyl-sn-glycerol-3-phosphate acyltransferase [Acholeplasmatales bacterium]
MKTRFRHTFTFWLLRTPFRIFARLRYNFTAVKFRPDASLKGPYLILSNHAMALDPFFLGTSFREPIYFVASDMIFSIRFWSRLIRFLVSPIPKTKYRSDMETVKDIIKIIKQGGSVGVFPEGNATFTGATMTIQPAIAKLVRKLKVPVLFYRFEGLHLTKPRWAAHPRRGRAIGHVHHVWRPEDYATLSVDAMITFIREQLFVDALATQNLALRAYKGRKLAEDLESAYFHCAECDRLNTIRTVDDHVFCQACGMRMRYTPYGFIEGMRAGKYYATTVAWYEGQLKALKHHWSQYDGHAPFFEDAGEKVLEVTRATQKKPLGQATLKLFKDRLVIVFDKGEEVVWPLTSLKASVQQKNKLILHHVEQQKTYYFLNHRKRNALKYVLMIETINGREV